MNRREFLVGIAALSLGGCGISRSFDRASDAFDFWWNGMEGVEVSRAQVAQIPYATILAKIGRGPQSLLVLGRIDALDLHWISADRNVFVTREGRLVKTVGLPANLVHTRLAGPDPLTTGAAVRASEAAGLVRYVDVMPGNYFDAGVAARYEPVGEERIEILELQYDCIVVRERNEVPIMDWSHENRFWIDTDSGFVWRSLQHFAPGTPPVEINITKPAALA
ncbi:MAG: YjbF family lipoprotein [Acetobacterales bacterium]